MGSLCSSNVNYLSFGLKLCVSSGSQRISDGDFSDYDCEDGIGVISGELCDLLVQVLVQVP